MSASAACWSSRALPGPATQRRTRSFARSRPLHCGAAGPGTGGISNGTTDLASGAGSAAAAAAAAAAATPTSSSCSAVDAFPAAIAAAVCDEPSLAPRSPVRWPQKSELYILRSDGYSCTRETVQPSGNLQFACPSSQQQLLVWKTRPQRVMVLKKLGDELMEEYVDVLRYLGEDLGMRVVVEPHDHPVLRGLCMNWIDSYDDEDVGELHSVVDFIVCLGGDGLLLHAASLFGTALPPIISFKLGSLGFLTTHNYVDYRRHLRNVVQGCRELETCQAEDGEEGAPLRGVHITLRMRLQCEVWRAGGSKPAESFEVLNEVVLSRGANPYLSKIEVYEANRLITKVQADGVMLATPTGSTAYNVAAGGSMVHPSVPAILFTPICPHSLNFRPVILPDYADLELRIADDARCSAIVCFDGRDSRELDRGDSIKVRMSPNPVPTINNADQTTDWFASIQRCFHWSERIEQLPINASLLEGQLSAMGNSMSTAGSNHSSSSNMSTSEQ
ncbi:hypothetical protein D9Q98_002892 [Chlorella vulgaris]|uniref:NAD(+) kinase n=1 Tax=Chlorella vulgaris TaxID=3077 RepID=A0A9D4TU87_CHLVU|nr:hypothetical protein D9Q98_002892 [Chlorella vulgaris]